MACIPQQAILDRRSQGPGAVGSGVTSLSGLAAVVTSPYFMSRVLRPAPLRSVPAPSIRWDAKLTRPLQVRDGPKLETLADASRLIAKLPWRYQRHQAWISATELLMTAAERGGSVESATDQIEGALFLSYMLPLVPVPAATKAEERATKARRLRGAE